MFLGFKLEGEVDIVRGGGGHPHHHHHQHHNPHDRINDDHNPLQVRGVQSAGSKTARGQLNVTGALTNAKIPKKAAPRAPPKSGAFAVKHRDRSSIFRQFYDRGDLPCSLENDCRGNVIKWRNVDVSKLDYHHYLPLFFDGLREVRDPYCAIACVGVQQMLEKGPHKVTPVIPQLILPIKMALETNDVDIMCRTLEVVKQLVLCGHHVGDSLVPYYRQILPALNKFKNRNTNCGDRIDYSQRKNRNLGDLIDETLGLLEMSGGPDAFINIKYMVPTYESCQYN